MVLKLSKDYCRYPLVVFEDITAVLLLKLEPKYPKLQKRQKRKFIDKLIFIFVQISKFLI